MRSNIIIPFLICIAILLYYKTNHKYLTVTGTRQIISDKITVKKIYSDMNKIVKEFRNNKNLWGNVIEIGEIYSRGLFPYLKPDHKMAMLCFEVASKSPDPVVVGLAKTKISELIENPIDEEDQQGTNINISYGKKIVSLANKYIDEVEEIHEEEPIPFFTKVQNTGKHVNKLGKTIDETIGKRNSEMRRENNEHITKIRKRAKKRKEELLRPDPPVVPAVVNRQLDLVGGGNQNTHDHGVTTSTKLNIANIWKEFKNNNMKFRKNDEVTSEFSDICKQIRNDQNAIGFDSKSLKDSQDVANSLKLHTKDLNGKEILYSNTGVSQINILDMILWKIRKIPDKELRKSVSETLCKRLADGKENGHIVCGTGKVSRIVSVFEGVLEDQRKCVSLKLIEKEIAQLAAKVRDDFMNTLTTMGRKAYESVNSVPEYTENMTKIFLEKVRNEYLVKLKMSPVIIQNITDIYVQAF